MASVGSDVGTFAAGPSAAGRLAQPESMASVPSMMAVRARSRSTAFHLRCDLLSKLVYRERVHHAAVVACDNEEVVKTNPVLVAILALERQQLALVISRQRRGKHYALLAQCVDGFAWRQRVFRNFAFPGVAENCLGDYRGVLVPAVSDKVIRDAANDILPVTPDIPFAVVVRIDRIRAEAARHELWRAHGAGIRTGRIGRVHTFLAYEQQEFLEFPCEEFG